LPLRSRVSFCMALSQDAARCNRRAMRVVARRWGLFGGVEIKWPD
jgi:hypothetical protein